MRATLPRRALIDALKRTAPARQASSHLRIMGCARIEASAGQVEVTSTDLDLTIHHWLDALDVAPGVVAVPAAPLAAFLAAASSESATLTLADATLAVECGGASATFGTVSVDEWPQNDVPEGDAFDLTPETVDTFRRSMHALSVDLSRPMLCHLAISDGHAVALDGYRLIATPVDGLPDMLLSPALLRAALPVTPEGATLSLSRGVTSWSAGPTTVRCRPYDGDYPNWRQFFVDAPASITVNADELIDAAKVCTITGGGRPMFLEPGDDTLTIWRTDDDRENRTEVVLKAQTSGEVSTFGLSPRYLLDALDIHDVDSVQLLFIGPRKQIQWSTAGGSRYVLMPDSSKP